MSNRRVEVHVVDHEAGQKCDARCGTDWTREDNRAEARRMVRERFGERVSLTFVDLADDAGPGLPQDVLGRIRSGGLALPLLLINGEPRITGYFDMRMATDVIEAELEMQRD